MKFSVETIENGYVETLEINGDVYQKRWTFTETGEECEDGDFYDQVSSNTIGEGNSILLDNIYEVIDESVFASDFANRIGRYERRKGVIND